MGIEPTQSAWKADVLPLNYTRKFHLLADFIAQAAICPAFVRRLSSVLTNGAAMVKMTVNNLNSRTIDVSWLLPPHHLPLG